MSKETLIALDRDTERLMFAGAQVAKGDGDLAAKKEKLVPLAKNPTFAKVIEQVEKVQKSSGKTATTELLNLAALSAVVRGALAGSPAVTGELTPLKKTEPIESPLAPAELTAIVGALRGDREIKRRYRVVHEACERDTVRDLRIVPYAVTALGSGDWGLSNAVEEKLLPKLGRVVVEELRSSIRIAKGSTVDTRKLKVLAEIEKKDALPLLHEALQKGSPEMRSTALSELAELDPEHIEDIALKAVKNEKSDAVKISAISALGRGKSDEALDVLLKFFVSNEWQVRNNASWALASFAHPKTTERVLALLTDDLVKLTVFKYPKDPKGAAKKQADKDQTEYNQKVALLTSLMDVLASRKSDQTTEKVLAIYRTHKVEDVRNAAARSLLKSGYEGAFDELAQSVLKADWNTQSEFVTAIFQRDSAHAFDRLGPFLDKKNLKNQNQINFASQILSRIDDGTEPTEGQDTEAEEKEVTEEQGNMLKILRKDPRWLDSLLSLLENTEQLANNVLAVLARVKDVRVLDAVLKYLKTKGAKSVSYWYMGNIFSQYKDPRINEALIDLLEAQQGYWYRRNIYEMIKTRDEPEGGKLLRQWYSGKKRLEQREKQEVEDALQSLERDRTLTG